MPRLRNNDPKLTSITVFRTRRFDHEVWLCSSPFVKAQVQVFHGLDLSLQPGTFPSVHIAHSTISPCKCGCLTNLPRL